MCIKFPVSLDIVCVPCYAASFTSPPSFGHLSKLDRLEESHEKNFAPDTAGNGLVHINALHNMRDNGVAALRSRCCYDIVLGYHVILFLVYSCSLNIYRKRRAADYILVLIYSVQRYIFYFLCNLYGVIFRQPRFIHFRLESELDFFEGKDQWYTMIVSPKLQSDV